MFRNKDCRALRVGVTILAILASAVISVSFAKSKPKTKKITGHVLGYVPNLLKLNGDGSDNLSFVFIPDAAKKQGHPTTPVAIRYHWFPDEPELPDSFFDFSKHFEIKVSRDFRCDTKVRELFYIKLDYVGEPEKPSERMYYFRLAANAPKLDFADDLALPCYEMRPGNYSLLK